MTILVGCPPNLQGRSALELGAMLARSAGTELMVCSVVPAPWLPGGAQVDAEYLADMIELADRALAQARSEMPADVPAGYSRLQARSGASGLLQAAQEHDASMIVLGSSTAGDVRAHHHEQCRVAPAAQLSDSDRFGHQRPFAA